MSFPLQPLTLGNISVAAGMESIGGQEAPKISSLILSLSIAALTLSLSFAVVISLIVWVVG